MNNKPSHLMRLCNEAPAPPGVANKTNNNKFYFYIAQFPCLAQSTSHKKDEEVIDKKINTYKSYINK